MLRLHGSYQLDQLSNREVMMKSLNALSEAKEFIWKVRFLQFTVQNWFSGWLPIHNGSQTTDSCHISSSLQINYFAVLLISFNRVSVCCLNLIKYRT